MTPLEIREAVQAVISPHNAAPQIVPRLVDLFIDETIGEMALLAQPPSLRTVYLQDITADDDTYLFPTAMLIPLMVRAYSAGDWGRLTKTTREHLFEGTVSTDTDNATGGPQFYYEDGIITTAGSDYGKHQVRLWPMPSDTVTNGLELTYLRRPTRVSALTNENTEIIDIDAIHHFGIVYRVAYKLLLKQSTKLAKGVLDNYDTLWKQSLLNLKSHHSEAWLKDFKPTVGTFGGVGLNSPWRR